MRYVERHLAELKERDARVCNVDTAIWPAITTFSSDANGFVKNSPELCRALARAASAADVPHRVRPFPIMGGATDALPFSRFGLKAASLVSMRVPSQMVRWYHTPRDTHTLYRDPREGGTDGLKNVLKICVEWIRNQSDVV